MHYIIAEMTKPYISNFGEIISLSLVIPFVLTKCCISMRKEFIDMSYLLNLVAYMICILESAAMNILCSPEHFTF